MRRNENNTSTSPRPRTWMIACVLALVTFATFISVRHCGFVNYDDPDYVQQNKIVQQGLTWAGIKWAFTAGHAANWHPLTWLTHMIDSELHGIAPGWHHLTNVFLHVGNTVLLFLLFWRLTGALWRSALVAVLFGVHPLHVESVAWISERKDVLSTFFGLLSMTCYVRYARGRQALDARFPALAFGLALLFFACGLMSKPMLVTLPFVLLLLDYWPLQRLRLTESRSWLQMISEKLPFFVLSAISSYVTVQVQSGKTVQSLATLGLLDRLANVLVSYVLYLWKMVWPAKLAFFYPLVSAPPIWQAGLAAVILLGITVAATLLAKRHPHIIIGWLWYLGTLVPVIGIVHVGEQALADRYTYIPLIGIFIALVWSAPLVLSAKQQRIAYAVTACLVLPACIFMTVRQIGFWKDSRTMLERALAVTKDNFLAHNNYGVILADEGKLDEAIAHYEEAIRIKPTYARAFNNMGTALTLKGQYPQAIESYLKSLELRPHEAQTHHNLAVTYARTRRFDLTIEHCQEALRLNPGYTDAYYDLALALALTEQFNEAKTYFLKSLETEPGNIQTHLQLAKIYLRNKQIREATSHFRRALELDPNQLNAAATLIWILATTDDASLRNGTEALSIADYTSEALRAHPAVMRSIAAAYAELGRYSEAVATAERAVALTNEPGLQQSLEADLQFYRKGKPRRST